MARTSSYLHLETENGLGVVYFWELPQQKWDKFLKVSCLQHTVLFPTAAEFLIDWRHSRTLVLQPRYPLHQSLTLPSIPTTISHTGSLLPPFNLRRHDSLRRPQLGYSFRALMALPPNPEILEHVHADRIMHRL